MNKIHKDIILFNDNLNNELDIHTNELAAELLMPEQTFKRLVQKHKGDVVKIAEEFGVSTLAVRYRAKKLEIEGHRLD